MYRKCNVIVFTDHKGIAVLKKSSRVLVMVGTQVALLGYTTHLMFSIGPHTHTHMSTHTQDGKLNKSSKVHKKYVLLA